MSDVEQGPTYEQLFALVIIMRKALIKRHEVFDRLRRSYYDTDKVLKECEKVLGPYNKMYEDEKNE